MKHYGIFCQFYLTKFRLISVYNINFTTFLKGHNQNGFRPAQYWSAPGWKCGTVAVQYNTDGDDNLPSLARFTGGFWGILLGGVVGCVWNHRAALCLHELTAHAAVVLWGSLTVSIAALFFSLLVRHSDQWRLIRCPVLSPAGLVY